MPPHSGQSVELDPKVTPLQDRARATYEQIIQATGELLPEVGIERLSTNMIAERAGLTPPALYRYFPNKYAILSEMGRRLITAENETVEQWLRSDEFAIGSDLQAEIESFAALLDRLRDVVLAHPGGAWIYRAMSAVPVLQEMRRRASKDFIKVILAAVIDDFPKIDQERVRGAVMLTSIVNHAVTETMADDYPTAELLRREAAKMMSLYYRDVVISRASATSNEDA
ncbi:MULTISPECIES: TetR/AcrR family transcriptional regulator [Pseudomonadota]|jgi:AcrR family transcriptional regulator|uniref:TetR/AcrR family transcriptional regulator n=1 Tax=Pseudomonadota TaxID=1224 RepID=UPI0008263962|nr:MULTISPECIES: TetR/AcrR family transcriptional regulator [Pseudomonadota]